jgi:hypothetical protein
VGGVVFCLDASLYKLVGHFPFPGGAVLRQIPLIAALAFGALISATEPAAVFLPRCSSSSLAGKSIFN